MIPAVILLTCNLDRLDSNRDRDTDYSEVLKSAQTLHANVRMAPHIMPLPLPCKKLPVRCSLTVITSQTTLLELLTQSLNMPEWHKTWLTGCSVIQPGKHTKRSDILRNSYLLRMGWTKCVARIGGVRRAGGKTEETSSLFKPLVGKNESYYKEWSNIQVHSSGFITFIESPGTLLTWIREMPSTVQTFKWLP